MSFLFSPAAGSKIEILINANYVQINGADGIPEFGPEKGTYETTTISDLAKQFGADLPDPGEFTLTGIWDSTDPGQVYCLAAASAAAQVDSIKATYAKKSGGSTPATAIAAVLVLSFRVGAAKGGPQKFTSKMKLTGVVNFVAQT